jgi:hypothetical protein
MSAVDRKADLEALEVFSRCVATLHAADVEFEVEDLAEKYGVPWPDEGDEDDEPTAEELAESHRRRTGG